ncbi:hypothetical protein [Motilibacter deserti]|uniref:Uncharacterized protein n=1 Tax=Motilibacter deserti TaxID=2714956 RepID=A0ABX0GW89_9ACTN|nr:hypothetical protein [Motilibacter deserti]NHC15067.1 hypothetical protein [Motilibacter deserti]
MTSSSEEPQQFVDGDLEAGADPQPEAPLGDSGIALGLDPSNASSFEPEEDAAAAETPAD